MGYDVETCIKELPRGLLFRMTKGVVEARVPSNPGLRLSGRTQLQPTIASPSTGGFDRLDQYVPFEALRIFRSWVSQPKLRLSINFNYLKFSDLCLSYPGRWNGHLDVVIHNGPRIWLGVVEL